MLIISKTPVRISFFGGGTDYPDYFLEHSGAVLGTTIDRFVNISVMTFESAFFDHKIRVAYSRTELVKMVNEIEHPSVRECLKHRGVDGNLEVNVFSDLPARTGLGSSSSFTVGLLNALSALEGKKAAKQKLAEEACFVEQNLIHENVGSQDQFHAAFGGFNIIEFKATHIHARPLVFSREKREFLQDHLLVFYTGITRHASEIVKEQIENTRKKLNYPFLKRMHAMVYEAEEIMTSLNKEEMLAAFGKLLHEGWELKKKLSSKISSSKVDEAYDAALRAGAYGGKLCGAGSGGFVAFVVPKEKRAHVREALKGLQEVSFCFENEGSSIIYLKD